jgi:hypothetical protein
MHNPEFESRKRHEIFLLSNTPGQAPIQRVTGIFQRVKRPELEVDHLLPTSSEVKNEWSYTSTPSTCLIGVESCKKEYRKSEQVEGWQEKKSRDHLCVVHKTRRGALWVQTRRVDELHADLTIQEFKYIISGMKSDKCNTC